MMNTFSKQKEHSFSNRRENCVSKPSGSRGFEVACNLLLPIFLLFNRSLVTFVGFVAVPDTDEMMVGTPVTISAQANVSIPVVAARSCTLALASSIDHLDGAVVNASFLDNAIHYVATNTFPLVNRQLFIVGSAMHDAMHDSFQYYKDHVLPLYLDLGEWEPTIDLLVRIHLIMLVAWFIVMWPLDQLRAVVCKWQQQQEELADRKAIKYYTTDAGYKAMNDRLRSGLVKSDEMQNRICALKRALTKLQVYKDTVWRGTVLPPVIRKTLVKGAIYSDAAFMSSTTNMDMAFLHSPTAVLFEIESKSGVEIQEYSVYPDEAEVLFRPDTRFMIKRVVKGRRRHWRVVMQEIEEGLGK